MRFMFNDLWMRIEISFSIKYTSEHMSHVRVVLFYMEMYW